MFQAGRFIISSYAKWLPTPTIPSFAHRPDIPLLHRGVKVEVPLAYVAQSIWEGYAVLGTDGSVTPTQSTYSWILSTSPNTISADVRGGGRLPQPAQYADESSKRPKAAAIYASLHWIHDLLLQYPDHAPSDNSNPPLSIYVDNKAVLQDLARPVDDTTPAFHFLTPEYDIIQGIRTLRASLPVPVIFAHVKSHQDQQHPYEELTPDAQINILADQYAAAVHRQRPHHTGLFPSWIPGTRAALFHGPSPITKHIPAYVRNAIHAPEMKDYLIDRSIVGTGREAPWNDTVFDSIAWTPLHEVFKKKSSGQRLQISKLMHDLLPTARRQQVLNNKHNGRCFVCNLLWEDTNHVIRCSGEAHALARTQAFEVFHRHLQLQHTPDIMAHLICDCMQRWVSRHPITRPTWPLPAEPIHRLLTKAYFAQSRIGWDQFFRGCVALPWKDVIAAYYKDRRPGAMFSPEQWMRTTVDALWHFSLTLWRQRCHEFHGHNGVLSQEAQRQDALARATAVYRDTQEQTPTAAHRLLHRTPVSAMLTWTKQHLDAYLATAEMACDWNVEPG
jgi:hypothetical protein